MITLPYIIQGNMRDRQAWYDARVRGGIEDDIPPIDRDTAFWVKESINPDTVDDNVISFQEWCDRIDRGEL